MVLRCNETEIFDGVRVRCARKEHETGDCSWIMKGKRLSVD